MIGASERVSAEFLAWESLGRGKRLWPYPTVLEPPFRPFQVRRPLVAVDDGRKPTLLSAAIKRLSERLAPRQATDEEDEAVDESPPDAFSRTEVVEIDAHIADESDFDPRVWTSLFATVSTCAEPLSFEIIGKQEAITVQFAAHARDARAVKRQLEAHLAPAEFSFGSGALNAIADRLADYYPAIVEFGLCKEFMVPLSAAHRDPFIGLVGALSDLAGDEIGSLQVLFSPVSANWDDSIVRSVTRADGTPLFVNAPELVSGAKQKTAHSLYAAVIRIAAFAEDQDRTWDIACNLGAALGVYGSPRYNELVPLMNDGYPGADHVRDFVRRQSRRSGMILNAEELAGFVHLPSAQVRSARLGTQTGKTKAVSETIRCARGLRLGTNAHAGNSAPVFLSDEMRLRHVHVIGASGTGKSTFLFNSIRQSIELGEGCSVLDPHGDLVDRVLGIVPKDRIDHVVLLDPSDEEYVVGFNVLAAHSEWEKALLASDLVAVFRRLSTSWGDQLNSVLSNALLAFMESEKGGTLFDVRRFLLEPAFRAEFLLSVRDTNVSYYWKRAFPMLTGNRSVGPVVTRLDTFLSPKPIRAMVGQRKNVLDFRAIMDGRKIFLAKLPEGLIGKENAHLLGSLLVSKLQAAAMSRQRESAATRRLHTLYADEFPSFLTPSLAECLSGVRKYGLGLVLAHQEMRQVERDPDVASALLNAGTRIVFRVSDRDARALEGGFASFNSRDLQNLSKGRAICRIDRSDCDFNLTVELAPYPSELDARARSEAVVSASRARYSIPRFEAEQLVVADEHGEPDARTEAPVPVSKAYPKARADDPAETPAPATVPSIRVPIKQEPKVTASASVVAAMKATPEAKSEIKKEAVPSADLGKGGAQHKAVQDRIKEEAEKLGFRVTVEKRYDGLGQIDLVLSRESASIACEVTVENTIDYEVGNVAKCLKAGFERVAVVGVSDEKLGKLKAAVTNSLGSNRAERVGYFLPDGFIATLAAMPNEAPAPSVESLPRTRGGRTVKRKVVTLSPQEAKAKEDEALQLMAQMMKDKTRRG